MDSVNLNICIVWENEIRAASKLLQAARDEKDEDARLQRMTEAYAACEVALYGIHDDSAVVMCGSAQLHGERKRMRDERKASNTSAGK